MQDLGTLRVGTMSEAQLRAALASAAVQLNEHAKALLARREFISPGPVTLPLVACTVSDLGFPGGATLEQTYAAASERGLALCPLATGAYLRLAHREPESSDPVLSRHRPPDAALHVASPILDPAFDVPKGFYLRTVDGVRWLRGYRCDLDYVVGPETRYVFARHASQGAREGESSCTGNCQTGPVT